MAKNTINLFYSSNFEQVYSIEDIKRILESSESDDRFKERVLSDIELSMLTYNTSGFVSINMIAEAINDNGGVLLMNETRKYTKDQLAQILTSNNAFGDTYTASQITDDILSKFNTKIENLETLYPKLNPLESDDYLGEADDEFQKLLILIGNMMNMKMFPECISANEDLNSNNFTSSPITKSDIDFNEAPQKVKELIELMGSMTLKTFKDKNGKEYYTINGYLKSDSDKTNIVAVFGAEKNGNKYKVTDAYGRTQKDNVIWDKGSNTAKITPRVNETKDDETLIKQAYRDRKPIQISDIDNFNNLPKEVADLYKSADKLEAVINIGVFYKIVGWKSDDILIYSDGDKKDNGKYYLLDATGKLEDGKILSWGGENNKVNITEKVINEDSKEKINRLQAALKQLTGVDCQLTVVDAAKQKFSIFMEGDQPGAAKKIKDYFGDKVIWDTEYMNGKDYDEASDATYLFFQVKTNLTEANLFEDTEITVIADGEDDWNRKLYKDDAGNVYVMVDGVLYATTAEGEPNYPVRNAKITESKEQRRERLKNNINEATDYGKLEVGKSYQISIDGDNFLVVITNLSTIGDSVEYNGTNSKGESVAGTLPFDKFVEKLVSKSDAINESSNTKHYYIKDGQPLLKDGKKCIVSEGDVIKIQGEKYTSYNGKEMEVRAVDDAGITLAIKGEELASLAMVWDSFDKVFSELITIPITEDKEKYITSIDDFTAMLGAIDLDYTEQTQDPKLTIYKDKSRKIIGQWWNDDNKGEIFESNINETRTSFTKGEEIWNPNDYLCIVIDSGKWGDLQKYDEMKEAIAKIQNGEWDADDEYVALELKGGVGITAVYPLNDLLAINEEKDDVEAAHQYLAIFDKYSGEEALKTFNHTFSVVNDIPSPWKENIRDAVDKWATKATDSSTAIDVITDELNDWLDKEKDNLNEDNSQEEFEKSMTKWISTYRNGWEEKNNNIIVYVKDTNYRMANAEMNEIHSNHLSILSGYTGSGWKGIDMTLRKGFAGFIFDKKLKPILTKEKLTENQDIDDFNLLATNLENVDVITSQKDFEKRMSSIAKDKFTSDIKIGHVYYRNNHNKLIGIWDLGNKSGKILKKEILDKIFMEYLNEGFGDYTVPGDDNQAYTNSVTGRNYEPLGYKDLPFYEHCQEDITSYIEAVKNGASTEEQQLALINKISEGEYTDEQKNEIIALINSFTEAVANNEDTASMEAEITSLSDKMHGNVNESMTDDEAQNLVKVGNWFVQSGIYSKIEDISDDGSILLTVVVPSQKAVVQHGSTIEDTTTYLKTGDLKPASKPDTTGYTFTKNKNTPDKWKNLKIDGFE